jgi:hypothetical protein
MGPISKRQTAISERDICRCTELSLRECDELNLKNDHFTLLMMQFMIWFFNGWQQLSGVIFWASYPFINLINLNFQLKNVLKLIYISYFQEREKTKGKAQGNSRDVTKFV